MGTISTNRAAIKTALDAANVRSFDYSPNPLPFPCAIVGFPTAYTRHASFDGTADMTIPVTLYVPYAANRAAEDALEALIETAITAIETNGLFACSGARDFGTLDSGSGVAVALGCNLDINCI